MEDWGPSDLRMRISTQEVTVKGSGVASRSGFAPVGLAATPFGVVWRRGEQLPVPKSHQDAG